MASSDQGAQKPIRARGSSKCPYHNGKKVVYFCENCTELACVSCVSKIHKGHELEELGNIIPSAIIKIQDFIAESEKHELPRITGKIAEVNTKILHRRQHYQQEISKTENQSERMKEQIIEATRQSVKSYRDKEKQEIDLLDNHKTVLLAQVDDRSSRIQECRDTLRSENDVQIYDISSDLPSYFQDIPTPSFPAEIFITEKSEFQKFEKLIDVRTKRAPTADVNKLPHKESNYSVVSEFTPKEYCITSMRPATGNTVWISFRSIKDNKAINKILTANHKGDVQQTLDMKVTVVDFCLSPRSGILWFCSCFAVRVTRERGSVVKFQIIKEACSICLTADDHVVIGHLHEVVKYTQTGKVIHKTSGGYDPLVIYPIHISQCPITGHLAVVDSDCKDNGCSGQPAVWILDDHLNPLYKYCGDTPGSHHLIQPFCPSDACFTSNGSLAITDFLNKAVLLVNEKGQYLQPLYTHSESRPLSVCVHNDGIIWVSFNDGSVQLLKNQGTVHTPSSLSSWQPPPELHHSLSTGIGGASSLFADIKGHNKENEDVGFMSSDSFRSSWSSSDE